MAATLASEWLAPCVASAQALEALHCETAGEAVPFGHLDLSFLNLSCINLFWNLCYMKHYYLVQVAGEVCLKVF